MTKLFFIATGLNEIPTERKILTKFLLSERISSSACPNKTPIEKQILFHIKKINCSLFYRIFRLKIVLYIRCKYSGSFQSSIV